MALGHQSLLRTIEALGTRACDYSLRVPLGTGYLSLPGTKTSTRHSRKERVIFEDPGLVAWAAEPSKGLTPGDSICPVSATALETTLPPLSLGGAGEPGPPALEHAARRRNRSLSPNQQYASHDYAWQVGKLHHLQAVRGRGSARSS